MNVPKLRFKEFNDEWQSINLADIFQYFGTNSFSREQLSESGILKNLHYGDIHKKYNSIVNENDEITSYVKDINYVNKYELLKNNDLIFADASEDYEGIGKAVEVVNVNNNTISGLHTILARDNLNVFAPMFKGYYFNSPIVHNQIRVLANGFKVYGISKDSINKLNIKVPSINEQSKIANTLYLLDKKIELQSKKIEDLKLFKKGLLILKFSNKVKNIKLEEIIKKGKAGGTPKSTVQKYYDGTIPFLSISDISSQNKYIKYTEKCISEEGLKNSSTWLVPKNSIILSMYASYGLPCINKIELATSQAMYSMIFKDDIDVEFIYYYLYYLQQINYYDRLVSTGTQSNLNAEKVNKIKIYCPNYDIQKNISKLFVSCDRKILLEENKLLKLQELKKGLMQSMFV